MRRAFTRALFILIAVSHTGASGSTSYQDAAWRQNNDRGNRYEGLVSVSTSNPDLEVLSFGYFEPFRGNVNLKVRFFHPGDGGISLIGREIKKHRQYWMEAKPWRLHHGAWNEFSPWPTADVILRSGIPADNVGVLITLNGGRLLPAITYHTRAPDSVSEYTMYMQSRAALEGVKFTLAAVGGDGKIQPKVWSLRRQGGKVPFPVTLDVRDFPKGFLKLIVEREVSGDPKKQPKREFVFYHNPSLRG